MSRVSKNTGSQYFNRTRDMKQHDETGYFYSFTYFTSLQDEEKGFTGSCASFSLIMCLIVDSIQDRQGNEWQIKRDESKNVQKSRRVSTRTTDTMTGKALLSKYFWNDL